LIAVLQHNADAGANGWNTEWVDRRSGQSYGGPLRSDRCTRRDVSRTAYHHVRCTRNHGSV